MTVQTLFHRLAHSRALVLGLGESGLALARWCARQGCAVRVADTRENPPGLSGLRERVLFAEFISGPFASLRLDDVGLIAVSPGLSPLEPAMSALLEDAGRRGIPVVGEIELFTQALAEIKERTLIAAEQAAAEAAEKAAAEEARLAEEARFAEEARAAEAAKAAEDAAALEGAHEAAQETAQEAALKAAVNSAELSVEPQSAAGSSAAEPQTGVAEVPQASPAESVLDTLTDDAPAFVPPPVKPRGYEPVVLAITGTNGKTTTTKLTGKLCERAGKSVAVVGNISPAALDMLADKLDAQKADGTPLPDVWVLELSSFQLHFTDSLAPTAAAVLNLTQDHLDWHGDMGHYCTAKARIFGPAAQEGGEPPQTIQVLNRDDAQVMAMARPDLRKTSFGSDAPASAGSFGIVREGGFDWLALAEPDAEAEEASQAGRRRRSAKSAKNEPAPEIPAHIRRLMPVEALQIRGRHNASNALAALALARAAGLPLNALLHGLSDYPGEPHRVQEIARIGEVAYIDDSKGTNVGATVAALQSYIPEDGRAESRKAILIAGGDGKGQDFAPLADAVARAAKTVLLIGRDGPQIRAAVASAALDAGTALEDCVTLEDAVRRAAALAQPGDAVLLSPACASFDMFRGYAHRAEVFFEAVKEIALEKGGML
ncbi:MAG: UDP-N-acetylmuramoyl-L-alanine--D-glutamate ligase [Candidatus Protistobacter heckmanni]|nr:UDP-N-acetylmuramoyl-L-alanine--D-glutamate ligase [Candidatus Protistobacter heckmanni]